MWASVEKKHEQEYDCWVTMAIEIFRRPMSRTEGRPLPAVLGLRISPQPRNLVPAKSPFAIVLPQCGKERGLLDLHPVSGQQTWSQREGEAGGTEWRGGMGGDTLRWLGPAVRERCAVHLEGEKRGFETHLCRCRSQSRVKSVSRNFYLCFSISAECEIGDNHKFG